VQKWKEKKAKSEEKRGKGTGKSLSASITDSKRNEGVNKIGVSTTSLPNFREEI